MINLDNFERKIVRELQRDAAQTTAELAAKVGLSASPCWRRIDRLKKEGVIKGRVAVIDRRKIGLNAVSYTHLTLPTSDLV